LGAFAFLVTIDSGAQRFCGDQSVNGMVCRDNRGNYERLFVPNVGVPTINWRAANMIAVLRSEFPSRKAAERDSFTAGYLTVDRQE